MNEISIQLSKRARKARCRLSAAAHRARCPRRATDEHERLHRLRGRRPRRREVRVPQRPRAPPRRRARARRPPRRPRRPAGGRQGWPLGRGQEGTREDALGDRRCPIEDARLRSRATSTFSVGATGKRARGRGPFHLTRSRSKRRRDGFFRTMPSPRRNPRVRIELPDARRETRRAA